MFFVIFYFHLVVWYLLYEAGVGEISFLFLWTFTEWFVFITGSEVFRLTSKNSFIRLINLLTPICSFATETNSIVDHSYYHVIFKCKERENFSLYFLKFVFIWININYMYQYSFKEMRIMIWIKRKILIHKKYF